MLFAVDSGATLVGVTDYCNFPPAAKQKPSVGGMVHPNLERIAALHPDLILATVEGNSKEDVSKLESLGYRIFVTNPRTIDDVYKSLTDIGHIVGKDSTTATLVEAFKKREGKVLQWAGAKKKPKVLTIISVKPLMTVGPNTFIHQLIVKAGGVNVAQNAPTAYPLLSREEVVHQQPDIILATNDAVTSEKNIVKEFPEWKSLPAVKNGRVFIVDGDLLTRPGPRIIEGLEMLARLFHPEKFSNN